MFWKVTHTRSPTDLFLYAPTIRTARGWIVFGNLPFVHNGLCLFSDKRVLFWSTVTPRTQLHGPGHVDRDGHRVPRRNNPLFLCQMTGIRHDGHWRAVNRSFGRAEKTMPSAVITSDECPTHLNLYVVRKIDRTMAKKEDVCVC
jgi:hypothetical protein